MAKQEKMLLILDSYSPDEVDALLEDERATSQNFTDAYGDLLAHIADLEDLKKKVRVRLKKAAGKAGFVNGKRFKANFVKQKSTRFKSAPLLTYLEKNKLLGRYTHQIEIESLRVTARNSEDV